MSVRFEHIFIDREVRGGVKKGVSIVTTSVVVLNPVIPSSEQ